MRQAADSKRRHDTFEVGDIVFLKLQPYRQQSLAKRPCDKLAARFYGPFEVLAQVGPVAYRLNLPSSSKIHPVFHISRLKHVHGNVFIPTCIPLQLNFALELETEPEVLLDICYQHTDAATVTEVLIKWRDLPTSEATCELFHKIASHFPNFHLEDKVKLFGAGIVMNSPEGPHTFITYKRGGKDGNGKG